MNVIESSQAGPSPFGLYPPGCAIGDIDDNSPIRKRLGLGPGERMGLPWRLSVGRASGKGGGQGSARGVVLERTVGAWRALGSEWWRGAGPVAGEIGYGERMGGSKGELGADCSFLLL